MSTPIPPRSNSPLTQFTTSPRTCTAMITTASLHPQRRRRNHPIPAKVRAAPSIRKKIPTVLPKGASCLYATGLSAQTRSRGVPRQSKVVAARLAMTAPKNRKIPIAVNPRVSGGTAAVCPGSLTEPLDVGDGVNLHQRVAGNSACRGNGRSHRRIVAKPPQISLIHGGVVFQVIEVHVYFENFRH